MSQIQTVREAKESPGLVFLATFLANYATILALSAGMALYAGSSFRVLFPLGYFGIPTAALAGLSLAVGMQRQRRSVGWFAAAVVSAGAGIILLVLEAGRCGVIAPNDILQSAWLTAAIVLAGCAVFVFQFHRALSRRANRSGD